MRNLYNWLSKEKGYTLNDIEETFLRLAAGMPLPQEVRKDLMEYYKKYVATTNKRH